MENILSSAKKLFQNLIFVYRQVLKSKKYLKLLGAKKIKYIGNLKFTQIEKDRNSFNR